MTLTKLIQFIEFTSSWVTKDQEDTLKNEIIYSYYAEMSLKSGNAEEAILTIWKHLSSTDIFPYDCPQVHICLSWLIQSSQKKIKSLDHVMEDKTRLERVA